MYSIMRNRIFECLRVLHWRWVKNANDAFSYLLSGRQLDIYTKVILRDLREDGIVMSNKLTDPALLRELNAEAQMMFNASWDAARQLPLKMVCDFKGDRTKMDIAENKDFLVNLSPKNLTLDSIFLRYALQPSYIRLVSAYLGQRAHLRAVHLWLNYATDGAAASTQLFHRDGDDLMNVKIFTYLTDVEECNGPFTFIPGSQPLGKRQINPTKTNYDRVTDDQMNIVAPRDSWLVCVGNAGDVIFADTCGYHKGLKPTNGYRLMLMVHYVSRSASTGVDFSLQNQSDDKLSVEQLAVL